MSSGIVDLKRIRVQKTVEDDSTVGTIVYWMNRDCRVGDNWALLYAQELAITKKKG